MRGRISADAVSPRLLLLLLDGLEGRVCKVGTTVDITRGALGRQPGPQAVSVGAVLLASVKPNVIALGDFQIQESGGIPVGDGLKVLVIDHLAVSQLVQELQALLVAAERVVDAVEDFIGAAHVDQAGHGGEAEHAGGRDVHVLVPDLEEVSFRFGGCGPGPLDELVDPVQLVRKHFSHVAEEHLEIRVDVEQFRCEEPNDVERDLCVPVEAVIRQERGHLRCIVAMERGIAGQRVWCGMEIYGHVEPFVSSENRPEECVVVESTLGHIVHQGADKIQL